MGACLVVCLSAFSFPTGAVPTLNQALNKPAKLFAPRLTTSFTSSSAIIVTLIQEPTNAFFS